MLFLFFFFLQFDRIGRYYFLKYTIINVNIIISIYTDDKKRKRDRDRELQQSAGESSEPPMIVYTYDANNNIIPNPPAPTAAPARSSSGRNTSRGGGGGARASNSGIAAATFDPTLTNAEIYAALVAENQLLDEPIVPAVELRVIPPAVEGPPVICQPAWPSFMEAKPNFEQVINNHTLLVWSL